MAARVPQRVPGAAKRTHLDSAAETQFSGCRRNCWGSCYCSDDRLRRKQMVCPLRRRPAHLLNQHRRPDRVGVRAALERAGQGCQPRRIGNYLARIHPQPVVARCSLERRDFGRVQNNGFAVLHLRERVRHRARPGVIVILHRGIEYTYWLPWTNSACGNEISRFSTPAPGTPLRVGTLASGSIYPAVIEVGSIAGTVVEADSVCAIAAVNPAVIINAAPKVEAITAPRICRNKQFIFVPVRFCSFVVNCG